MADQKVHRGGETVEVISIQRDSDGKIMSELEVRWYGMTNEEANAMTLDLVTAVAEKAAGWGLVKASGEKVGVGKPGTGLISNR